VCADVDVDPEGNTCAQAPDPFARNCGRLDPVFPPNDYLGGFGSGSGGAGTLCCCGGSPPDGGFRCASAQRPPDVFSNGMMGCPGSVVWTQRASLCGPGCSVCTVQQWVANRNGVVPTHNYWTNDNLKSSGWGDGICNVSSLYGTDDSPSPMHVCAEHRDLEDNGCDWLGCGAVDIPPQPSEYLGGCSDKFAGTLCCKP
jgi:hypothetical protein